MITHANIQSQVQSLLTNIVLKKYKSTNIEAKNGCIRKKRRQQEMIKIIKEIDVDRNKIIYNVLNLTCN